jgi:UDP-N-acetylmuramate--alanine ligase
VEPLFVEGPDDVAELLRNLLQPGDLLLTQGAGDITRLAHQLKQEHLMAVEAEKQHE